MPSAGIRNWDSSISGSLCYGPWGGEFTVHDVATDLSRLSVTYELTWGIYTTSWGEISIGRPVGASPPPLRVKFAYLS